MPRDINDLDKDVAVQESTLKSLSQQVQLFESKVDARFDAASLKMDSKLDAFSLKVDTKLDALYKRLDNVITIPNLGTIVGLFVSVAALAVAYFHR